MHALVLESPRSPLRLRELPDPVPRPGEILIRVEACAVCRTDLHVIDGELPEARYPIVPGHEIVGIVEATASPRGPLPGERVGVPWLGGTCGHCGYCQSGRDNLCDSPTFTGCTRDGGFATHVTADVSFVVPLAVTDEPVATAPLLCAGLIGWRCLAAAGSSRCIGLYGFGAAAHILTQICVWQGRRVIAFTRPGDRASQQFARDLGAAWAGGTDQSAPEPLDAAIIFAPAGELVPMALSAVVKGGRVICGGIHMTDIPAFPYRLLWHERELMSIANLTRADAVTFLPLARQAGVRTATRPYPLASADQAIDDLRRGNLQGAAVLVPPRD